MTKLWQKGYQLNEQVERFEAAQNSLLDARLIRHDVWGSLAHAAMLAKIGVLTEQEHRVLKDTLCSILQLEASHEFIVTVQTRTCTPVSRITWQRQRARRERRFTWPARAM